MPPIKSTGEIIYNKSIRPSTSCRDYLMRLEVKPFPKRVIPGQFIQVSLRACLSADREQSDEAILTNPEELLLRRPFSIYNILNRPACLEILYRIVGKGTRLMTSMTPGTKVDILGPLGNGFTISESTTFPRRDYSVAWNKKADISILVAGGIGIAGLHLLLKTLIQNKPGRGPNPPARLVSAVAWGEPPAFGEARPLGRRPCGREAERAGEAGKIYLLIGAKNKEELYLPDTLRRSRLIGDPPKRRVKTMISTEDGSRGVKGLVTDLLEELLIRQETRDKGQVPIQLYACGPEGMLKAVADLARTWNLPCQVSLEARMACGLGFCRSCVCRVYEKDTRRYATVCSEGPVFRADQVVWSRH